MRQPVLPLLPADATPIGPAAGLVDGADGGTVFVFGQAAFAFATDDEVGRRLAAVQLVATDIASAVAVAAGFGIGLATLWRWKAAYDAGGVAGLIPAKPGPKRPTKLTAAVVARIGELAADGQTLTAIAATVGVDVATVRVALGRRRGSAGWEARQGAAGQPAGNPGDGGDDVSPPPGAGGCGPAADPAPGQARGAESLPVLPAPEPRTSERALARTGQLTEAPVVFTEGAHLPLAGLLLILPALAATGLTEAFATTYGRLRNACYGLRSTLLMLLFLALLRDTGPPARAGPVAGGQDAAPQAHRAGRLPPRRAAAGRLGPDQATNHARRDQHSP